MWVLVLDTVVVGNNYTILFDRKYDHSNEDLWSHGKIKYDLSKS